MNLDGFRVDGWRDWNNEYAYTSTSGKRDSAGACCAGELCPSSIVET